MMLGASLQAQVKCNGGLFFKLEHRGTRVNGNIAAIDFMLTNRTDEDIDINMLRRSTTVVDNFGRTYTGDEIRFDFANTGYENGMLPGKVSVKLRCTINGVDEGATSFPIMMMKYKCSISDGEEWILFARKVKFQ